MDFLIIAHTGCNGTKPNTIHSLLAGKAWGADICEVDLRSTLDGQVVLWHDSVLQGRNIADWSLNEFLEALRRSETDTSSICTLPELCEVAKEQNIRLNLDIKDDQCVPHVVRIIKEYRLQESVFFTGCESLRAKQVKTLLPEANVFLNISDSPVQECAPSSADYCGLNLPYSLYSEALQDYAQRAGLWVWVWTVEQDFHRFTEAQGITTNHVKELAAFRGLRR